MIYSIVFLILTDMVKDCFSSFHHPEIIPVIQIGPYNILEMWHGPTGAFKDLAFALFSHFVNHFLQKQGKKGTAIVSTLGDTGSAAIQAFKNSRKVNLIVLYPKHSISRLQRLQMTTVQSPNVRTFSCNNASDSFDNIIIDIFNDQTFAKKYNMLWVNSPNVGRVVCHTVHHIYTYLKLCPSCDNDVTFYIPSGALVDSTSAYLSQCMGIPIKVVSVVNENDFFHKCLTQGYLYKPLNVINTPSCSMDTVFPHNIERILFLLVKGDATLVKSIMEDYHSKGVAKIPQTILDVASKGIHTERVTQEEALSTAKMIWEKYHYIICPHTAVGVAGATKADPSFSLTPSVCLATATAAKFPDFVRLIGDNVPIPNHPCVDNLEGMTEYYQEMNQGENWEDILRETIVELY